MSDDKMTSSATNPNIVEFQKNRYICKTQAPFIVHIESTNNKNNIGHIDPIRLGEILIKAQINFENVRKIGPKKIELTFSSLEEANLTVESPKTIRDDWIYYIPNYKVLKIGQVHGIDASYSIEKLKLAIESDYKDAKIERISKKVNEELEPTSSIKIFFKSTKLPEKIKFFGVSVNVYPYIFNVLQCKNCYRFGHSASNCSRNPVCAECSSEHDPASNCVLSKRCINCKGKHSALDKQCLKYLEQKEIKYVMATKNISLNHAKSLFHSGYLNHYRNAQTESPYSHALTNSVSKHQSLESKNLLNNPAKIHKRRRSNSPTVQLSDDDSQLSGNRSESGYIPKHSVASQNQGIDKIDRLIDSIHDLVKQNAAMHATVFTLTEILAKEKGIQLNTQNQITM